ncbi:hypothetical protein F5148DRAFT_847385 [Russula earlei]|uniref:Uncharacterized protein n=1 Tax=Russula earlei TaxID=71964 RepID=A0ACC0TTN5_9AGAM|nr:hypothetical protein F5148DRAFT_847385 [Russula earlei]
MSQSVSPFLRQVVAMSMKLANLATVLLSLLIPVSLCLSHHPSSSHWTPFCIVNSVMPTVVLSPTPFTFRFDTEAACPPLVKSSPSPSPEPRRRRLLVMEYCFPDLCYYACTGFCFNLHLHYGHLYVPRNVYKTRLRGGEGESCFASQNLTSLVPRSVIVRFSSRRCAFVLRIASVHCIRSPLSLSPPLQCWSWVPLSPPPRSLNSRASACSWPLSPASRFSPPCTATTAPPASMLSRCCTPR